MTTHSELKSATIGFVRNSKDVKAVSLILFLLQEIEDRDRAYEKLKHSKTKTIYKDVDPTVEYHFGPGGA